MGKKIKTRDPIIPKVAGFACDNCNTEFDSDEFEIHSRENYVRDEKVGWFSGLSSVRWSESVYTLETSCPMCNAITSITISKGLPLKRNEITNSEASWW